jgi:uncharacterized protein YjlB
MSASDAAAAVAAAAAKQGGTIVAPVQRADDRIGTGIEGGTPQKMMKGDFLLIPAGIPHQITDVQGVFTPLTLHLPMVK